MNVLDRIKKFFVIRDFLLPQQEAEAAIREGVNFRGMNMLILIVAIFIASLGLNVNSTAVIIGAMLISPLMGPIIGMGLAVGILDFELLKRAFRNLAAAALFSMTTATIYFLISPVNDHHSELLARTSPSIYDVLIGFFGGLAGILAIGSKSKGNVIPGVAIATALMPPLCTAGYGIATLQPNYFLGALYLFFINSVFIALATFVGVKLMKYEIKHQVNLERARKVKNIVYVIAVVTLLPSLYLTYRMYVQNKYEQNCSLFVSEQLVWPNTQVLNYNLSNENGAKELTVALMGQHLQQDSLLAALELRLPQYHLQGLKLRIIQGQTGVKADDMTRMTGTMLENLYTKAMGQQAVIDSLRSELRALQSVDSLGVALAPELKVLFPRVADLAVTHAMVCSTDSGAKPDSLTLALVRYSGPMSAAEQKKFADYLQARLHTHRVKVLPTPEL